MLLVWVCACLCQYIGFVQIIREPTVLPFVPALKGVDAAAPSEGER